MRRPRKLGTRTRPCSLVTEFGVLKERKKEESFGKYRVHLAYKDADLFPKGSVLELYSLKPAG